jgi:hypothetical protein
MKNTKKLRKKKYTKQKKKKYQKKSKKYLRGGAAQEPSTPGAAAEEPSTPEMVDCDNILLSKKKTRQENIGNAPTNGNAFIQKYNEDTRFKNFIDEKWGEHAFKPSTIMVTLANKMRDGITSAWGKKCTGKRIEFRPSRHNAKNKSVNCCSKFRNGQIADDVKDASKPEACGYGWTGSPEKWDEDLQIRRTVPPPAWMADILALQEIDLPGCNITLKSGEDFVDHGIYEALAHLNAIHQCICKSNNLFGTRDPLKRCYNCERKINEFYENLDSIESCENTILRIITMFQNIHDIARGNLNKSTTKALNSFGTQFVKLCNKLPGAGEVEGGGNYKKLKYKYAK